MFRIALLVVALAASGAAAWLAYGVLATPKPVEAAGAHHPNPMVEILVAAHDIAPGQNVDTGDFAWRPWPEDLINPSYIRRDVEPDAPTRLDGAVARGRFASDEPVLPSKLAQEATNLMAALLEPGERAMAVSVSAESSAGGFVLPGDRVDVLLIDTFTNSAGRRESEATTILRDIEVLAVDQSAEAESGDALVAKTTTLRLTEAQAERLVAAGARGDIALSLRAAADRGVTYAQPEPEPEPSESVKAEANTVIVRRGGEAQVVAIP